MPLRRITELGRDEGDRITGGKTCDCECECTCSMDSVTDDTMTSTRDSNMLSTFAS
ncbi:hypothetical protein TheveDRAFT_0292 [Thermanaerovibrio velox DSM 12556]|uniref:Uncharacterized protein n=1 Tax=Thermanaerovibrio velox DSM 12556 TaxID=926567 RepID=H0UNX6_9BACT|nr:hypothetical protein [Thermanaerovibrio velox]EHM09462.1 hypothetical protein TheveDRAFT_0292 [Thermanaerovibrio velox DSM 12556]